MASVERISIDDIRHPLIDPRLHLTPVRPNGSHWGWAWLDQTTGLSFDLELEKNALEITGNVFGYWHFNLWHPNHPKPIMVWHFKSDVTGPPRHLCHNIFRSKAFEWADSYSDDRDGVRATIDSIGGREVAFDFCLSAIRASACKPFRIETLDGVDVVVVKVSASNVDFVIHD
jgi:hypothetical protein